MTHSGPPRNHRTREMERPVRQTPRRSAGISSTDRVDDHHLVDPRPNAFQTRRQGACVVPNDHAQRDPRPIGLDSHSQTAGRHTSIANGPGISRAGPAQALGEGLLTPPSRPDRRSPSDAPAASPPTASFASTVCSSRTIAPFQPTFRETAARFRRDAGSAVNACPHKGPPAVMMDERVARDHRPIPAWIARRQ